MPSRNLYARTYGPRSWFARWLARNDEKDNVTINGRGAGATKITFPVELSGQRPKIQGVTIEAKDCLTLNDCGECLIDDVWLNVQGGTAIDVRLGNRASSRWNQRQKEDPRSRISLPTFRDIHIIGEGNGWRFGGYDWKTNKVDGCFMGNIGIYGGHTSVTGTAMYLEYLSHLGAINHHMDCARQAGLILGPRVWNVLWYAPGFIEAGGFSDDWIIDDKFKQLHPIGWAPDPMWFKP